MSIIVKDSKTNTIITFKVRYTRLTYFFLILLIELVDLSSKRDLIFELKQLNTLTLTVSIID